VEPNAVPAAASSQTPVHDDEPIEARLTRGKWYYYQRTSGRRGAIVREYPEEQYTSERLATPHFARLRSQHRNARASLGINVVQCVACEES